MITRDLGGWPWAVAGWQNPPPLMTYSPQAEAAAWHPVRRPVLRPTPAPAQYLFRIPTIPFGDDPTDRARQTKPRLATTGMVGRLHQQGVRAQ